MLLAYWLFHLCSTTGASVSPLSSTGNGELICHTDDLAECYPKVFQATNEFQTVRPDQDLVPGLHVRLNVWTGKREAKLNDPSEQDSALAGLPIDRAVVLVDPEPPEQQTGHHIRPGAPAFEVVGKVKEPTGPEAREFYDALSLVKESQVGGNVSSFGNALNRLNELSHDMYYGLKISQDLEALQSLFCFMSRQEVPSDNMIESVLSRALLAARTISAAVQNNPAALEAVEMHWDTLVTATCSSSGEKIPLGSLVFSLIQSSEESVADVGQDLAASLLRAKLAAIKGLIRSPRIRKCFLDKNGMLEILRVLLSTDPAYCEAQVKAANLVMDTFLDENMGATLGLWPGPAVAEAGCGDRSDALSDGCWLYYIRRLVDSREYDPGHWSSLLLNLLMKQSDRDGNGARSELPHDEL